MANLLTWAEIKAKLNLPDQLQSEMTNFIELIEEIKIKNILGEDLLTALKAGSYAATLKPKVNLVTIYWTYDKYLREGNSKNTVFGAIQKTHEYGINEKYERQLKIDSNLETAHYYERVLWEYLQEYYADFAEYDNTNLNKTQAPKITITPLDRNSTNYGNY